MERPMAAAMPCKRKDRTGNAKVAAEEIASKKVPKTICGCTVESDASTRQRVESCLPTKQEDHIAGKGFTSMAHYNLVHKFISMPQAMKIPDAKAAVDKEWKKLETIPAHGNWRKSRARRRLFSKHKETKRKSTLLH